MDPKGNWWLAVGAAVILLVAGGIIYKSQQKDGVTGPVPSDGVVSQLPVEKHPKVELDFTSDGHEVTVNVTNLYADQLEYTLQYTADVRKGKETMQIQTGVAGGGDVAGQTTYSEKQLLGSESSGKRVYHENITNANFELTLRDEAGRSIFTATYPFEVKAESVVQLNVAE